jgi:zinc protease
MKTKFIRPTVLGALTTLCLWAAFALLMPGLLCSCQSAARETALPHHPAGQCVWPQDHTDIAPDPDLHFGKLDNGMRFIIKENHTPRDRVSMHLFVQAGSLLEKSDEQGMAHLIEHMLFDGSTHFDPGELVKFFQRIGMQFGPDANAHTGFTQTVFDVVLPKGDAQSLSDGLLVLRDYADGALLLPEEVKREKKVVLAEMRSRDSAQFRTYKAALQFELPGLLIGHRFPIGQAGIIKKMDCGMLRQFYRTWYRPERMILVIVGDLKYESVLPLIRTRFGNLEAHAPAQLPPAVGSMKHQGLEAFYHHEEESGMTQVSIETVVQQPEPRDSMAFRKSETISQLAGAMIQHRLDALTQSANSVITDADIGAGYYLQRIKYAQIEADCKPNDWQQALAEIEQTLRKALVYGFTPSELQRVKKDFKAQLLKAVQQERTRDSNELAREILSDLEDWRVYQSPDQRWQMLAPFLGTISLSQIRQMLMHSWNGGHRLLLVTGNADLSSDTKLPTEQIKTAYLVSSHEAVHPDVEEKAAKFPYLPDPVASGTIVQRRHLKTMGIEQVTFANGFSLNLKPTRFKENQVKVALAMGCGEACEPAGLPGLSKMAEGVIDESGFGALNRIELAKALSGRLAEIEFDVREDMILVKGVADRSELPLLFQLLYTFVEDPGIHEDARRLVMKRFEQEYKSMPHSVDGMMQLRVQNFLAGGDPRFGAPPLVKLEQCSNQEIKTWLKSQMKLKSMELAIVGDFNPGEAEKLAALYFGSLKATGEKSAPSMAARKTGPEFPRGQSLHLAIASNIPKALVVVAFPTEDFWDIRRTRRLNVIAELFSERLRRRIREKMGAAYSPDAFSHSYRAYKGYGMIQIHVLVDPHQTEVVVEAIHHIANAMADETPDADEFKRVLDPTLTYIKDLRQTNEYWLDNVLTGASRYPQQLDWSRTIDKDYASITAKEITALARRYLVWSNAAVVIIAPEKNGP